MSDAVILLSGGLDSTANLALASKRGKKIRKAITFDYGQKAVRSEMKAAERFCEEYEIPHQRIELPWFGLLGESALTRRESQLPHPELERLDDPEEAKKTAKAVWVPNRNGVLISIGAAIAESEGASEIIVGFNLEEAQTFPDNSEDYLKAMTKSLEYSTSNQVRVISLTADLSKTQIVQTLKQEVPDFPFDWVWSCYEDRDTPCGQCESCLRFFRATRTGELL